MDRWIDGQMDRYIDRLIDRQIDRQIDREIEKDRKENRFTVFENRKLISKAVPLKIISVVARLNVVREVLCFL